MPESGTGRPADTQWESPGQAFILADSDWDAIAPGATPEHEQTESTVMPSTISDAGGPVSIEPQRAAGVSIILAATLFWAFWFSALLWQDGGVIIGLGEVAWTVQLAIHALTVLLLGWGLVMVTRSATERRGPGMAGVVLLPLGMVTIPPVMWVGIVVLAAHAWAVNHRITAGMLLAGAGGLVTAYALGARVGTEGMPTLSTAQAAWYGAGLTVTALALVGIGFQAMSRRARPL